MNSEMLQKIAEEAFADELQKVAFNIKTDKKALLMGIKHGLGQKAKSTADSAGKFYQKNKKGLQVGALTGLAGLNVANLALAIKANKMKKDK